ncbi:MAG: hypothetical protein BWZ02_02968 [Lentisphaerae bacterium ADurb.BinA184]|nr:MAG: hypothetical protein BWZ02_02968 [Lentisphaerae bacterium ADurb.BinA184]
MGIAVRSKPAQSTGVQRDGRTAITPASGSDPSRKNPAYEV